MEATPPRAETGAGTASYIIVGAGIFGVSTALHLIRKYPGASITLVDRDPYDKPVEVPRVAASWDLNKMVRADYTDVIYCRLAVEAMDQWRDDPLWKPFFHQTGMYWISRTDRAQKVVEAYEAVGRSGAVGDVRAVPVPEAKTLYGGMFDEADYQQVESVLVSKSSGWADARGALKAVTEATVGLGVKYVTAEVSELIFTGTSELLACTGVRTAAGKTLNASHVILSTGAFTSRLLEESAVRTGKGSLGAGERIMATGFVVGLTQLDDEDATRFANMPACIQENPPDRGGDNGALPPNKQNQIKLWGQRSFKNTLPVDALLSGSASGEASMPPRESDYSQWNVPQVLIDDVEFAKQVTFGTKGKSWEMEQHRICWDAMTPSQDFIISKHPAAKNLYIATCGSFHGFKFFPNIGSYVLQMLEGTLPQDLQGLWAWDRELPSPENNIEWPKFELKDLFNQ